MDLDLKIHSSPLLHIANVACASARECEVHKSIYRKGMGWSLLSCLFCSLCTGPESFYREFAFEVPTPTAQQQQHKSTLTNSRFCSNSSNSKETGEFPHPQQQNSNREEVKDPSSFLPRRNREESSILRLEQEQILASASIFPKTALPVQIVSIVSRYFHSS